MVNDLTVDVVNDPTLSVHAMVSRQDLIPTYAHPGDAGMDLYNALETDMVLPPHQVYPFPTGVRLEIPKGWVGLINPRSGLGSKGITVANAPGTIDSGYRGEIKVLLINNSGEEFVVYPGNRIAQILFMQVETAKLTIVQEFSDSVRGSNGFGSSGGYIYA